MGYVEGGGAVMEKVSLPAACKFISSQMLTSFGTYSTVVTGSIFVLTVVAS